MLSVHEGWKDTQEFVQHGACLLGFATYRLGDTVLCVGGYAGTMVFCSCQGMALAHMWFSRGSWSPRASETPGCGKLISWG